VLLGSLQLRPRGKLPAGVSTDASSFMMTHLGNEKTTVRRSLLVVFGGTSGRPISGQRCHDDSVLQLKLSNVPWRKERVAAGCVGHVGYVSVEVE
jgi:hypothetical protein